MQVFRVSEERGYEPQKKPEPAQSQAADRFEQRIQQHRQQHKEEMEVHTIKISAPYFLKLPVKWECIDGNK